MGNLALFHLNYELGGFLLYNLYNFQTNLISMVLNDARSKSYVIPMSNQLTICQGKMAKQEISTPMSFSFKHAFSWSEANDKQYIPAEASDVNKREQQREHTLIFAEIYVLPRVTRQRTVKYITYTYQTIFKDQTNKYGNK